MSVPKQRLVPNRMDISYEKKAQYKNEKSPIESRKSDGLNITDISLPGKNRSAKKQK